MGILAGQLALITGGGRGNGAAIAHGMAIEGSQIIVTDVDGEAASVVANEINAAGGKALSFPLDVVDRAACVELAATVSREVGAITCLVNNAGICPRNSIDSADVFNSWKQGLDVNLNGTLNVTLAFLAQLRSTKGTIINMASIASFVSTATSVSYSTSKAAIRMLTQNLAQELAKDGIRVNAIAPGTIATKMTEATRHDPVRSRKFLARIPMGRFGEPNELVGPVNFLASSMSSYVTGTTLVVDGGYLAV